MLLIMDGFGYRPEGDDNAILHARAPHWKALCAKYAFGTIEASEHSVGLPAGQFGNSEVGHLNIGAGRIVQQDISRIDCDIEAGTFEQNPTLQEAFRQAHNGTLHVMGLLSDGGVHSHENHIHAVLRAAQRAGVQRVAMHAFLDGRDTPPQSARRYLERLDAVLADIPVARLASMTGRYWAMDRDKRWERVETAYRLLVDGAGEFHAETGLAALEAAYQRGENDEFVKPTAIGAKTVMADGDSVLFMNFRADRARQLVSALTDARFDGFKARQPKFAYFATLTRYGEEYPQPTLYAPQTIKNGLGEYLAGLGLHQLRIAETEKYPHVTYFFNGGEEQVYPGEDRILVPSPKVATYDLQPEMSAPQVADHIVEAIASNKYDAIICNFANGDMVGHTGNFDAAVRAVEALDSCIARCVDAMLAAGGEVVISADHGNCEKMYDAVNGQPHTQHTTNQVPFLYIGRAAHIRAGGALRDIAPSMLSIMGLDKPAEMTGESLIDFQ
ncbi:phosphoglycerate mutase [Paludibacterium purpuratum]|uniref:2,3-bisphosphoglycerate-independent phosphoglycerate mutase n=2 Tax=Paludibacterium purpuratum TaxID=1144873 RepID=A0A4V3DVM3_9NEIS|nr:phosphoglycerate mutase [Paludibacterium purpuratum]